MCDMRIASFVSLRFDDEIKEAFGSAISSDRSFSSEKRECFWTTRRLSHFTSYM